MVEQADGVFRQGTGTIAMQPYPLLLHKFIDHAAKWHADTEVVTGGSATRWQDRLRRPSRAEHAIVRRVRRARADARRPHRDAGLEQPGAHGVLVRCHGHRDRATPSTRGLSAAQSCGHDSTGRQPRARHQSRSESAGREADASVPDDRARRGARRAWRRSAAARLRWGPYLALRTSFWRSAVRPLPGVGSTRTRRRACASPLALPAPPRVSLTPTARTTCIPFTSFRRT